MMKYDPNIARENYAFWFIQEIIAREIKKAYRIRG